MCADWGDAGANHKRVATVVTRLRKAGFCVWFDETHMSGNILDSMSGGIEQARTVLVFVTNNYIRKVTSGNGNDNVRREFMFASSRSEKMLMVKLEPVEFPMPGAILGNDLFVDLCFVDAPTSDQMDLLIREIRRRETALLQKRNAAPDAQSSSTGGAF